MLPLKHAAEMAKLRSSSQALARREAAELLLGKGWVGPPWARTTSCDIVRFQDRYGRRLQWADRCRPPVNYQLR